MRVYFKQTLFALVVFSISSLSSSTAVSQQAWYAETLYEDWCQALKIDKILKEIKTEHQHLMIFENNKFGRVLTLDGILQTTEADEFVYHEMMVHVPLIAHGNAKKVLVIGGGDGGAIREVARHPGVENIVMVDIDASVINLCKEYLPTLSNGAFDDPRVQLIITDAAEFVKTTAMRFDIIICDSTDPIGPGEALYTEEFYGNCKRCLEKGGIFVNQNGVPFMQDFEIGLTFSRRATFFKQTSFYVAPIPTYIGGFMAFGWATDEEDYLKLSLAQIQERAKTIQGALKYYTPEIHVSSFALPLFIKNLIPQNN